jgi:transcriptional regulator with XRE-family HTH domain
MKPPHITLRDERKRLGIAQGMVATLLGVDRSYISKLETGSRKITAQIIHDYKHALVSIAKLKSQPLNTYHCSIDGLPSVTIIASSVTAAAHTAVSAANVAIGQTLSVSVFEVVEIGRSTVEVVT